MGHTSLADPCSSKAEACGAVGAPGWGRRYGGSRGCERRRVAGEQAMTRSANAAESVEMMALLAGALDAPGNAFHPRAGARTGTPPRINHESLSLGKRREEAPSLRQPQPVQKRQRVATIPAGAVWTNRDREWQWRDKELTQVFQKGWSETPDCSFLGAQTSVAMVLALLNPIGVGQELSIRPDNVEYPGSEALFREQRPQPTRRYARNMTRALDVWKPHGGTSTRRLPLPPSMQIPGLLPQEIIRRSGKIVRPGTLPTLRFRQYEVGTIGRKKPKDATDFVLFHVLPDAVGANTCTARKVARAAKSKTYSENDVTPPTERSDINAGLDASSGVAAGDLLLLLSNAAASGRRVLL